ncbi:uncharacterized protein G2W53_027845 [Senna tora]|uniref:Rapid ALkalinization Factor n=1 Tax=Senna tora TaxID=362788 RepID=A0A834TIH8_9FABA|nr:uncharacterized protein G2W53_027845 [Senna tora]
MKKQPSLLFLLSLILLLQADLSIATSGMLNGNSTAACGGSVDCLIGEEWEAAEFPMNSHIARMLYNIRQSTTGRTGNPNQASVNCPQTKGYRSCLPSKNGGPPKQSCGDYTRNC